MNSISSVNLRPFPDVNPGVTESIPSHRIEGSLFSATTGEHSSLGGRVTPSTQNSIAMAREIVIETGYGTQVVVNFPIDLLLDPVRRSELEKPNNEHQLPINDTQEFPEASYHTPPRTRGNSPVTVVQTHERFTGPEQ